MKNFNFVLLLLAVLPTALFSQKSFDFDLSFKNKINQKSIVNEDLKSVQVIDQINALEIWLSDKKEYATLDLKIENQTHKYDLKRMYTVDNVEVQFGNEAPSVQSFLAYHGFDRRHPENMVTIIMSEDGKLFFSQENLNSRFSILKNFEPGRSEADYKMFLVNISDMNKIECDLDHGTIAPDEIQGGSRNNEFNHTEYVVDLGFASDFEFLQLRGGNVFGLFFEMLADATGAAAFYGTCDMRVFIRLVNVRIEMANNDFYITPFCPLGGGVTTDAFLYNQAFAGSINRPFGDVITLWTGTDIRGALCISDIIGMANLIGGVCNINNSNVCEAPGTARLQAHEIGHNLGIGINHGNITGPFFYGTNPGGPWHPNTISTIHQKIRNKGCVDQVNTCCTDIEDVYLCGGQTTFCIDLPACAGNIDVGSTGLTINAMGQLCGTLLNGTRNFTVTQRTPNLNCFVNQINFKVKQCDGSTPFYNVPPVGMDRICIDDIEEHCYTFACVESWEIQGAHSGLFVHTNGAELCIASRGFGRPGPTTLTIRPNLICGGTGPWVTWTIILEDCESNFPKVFNQNVEVMHNEIEPIANVRRNVLSVTSMQYDLPTQIQLYTTAGQLISTKQGFGSFEFDLTSLPAGLYIAVISQGEQSEVKKIVRE